MSFADEVIDLVKEKRDLEIFLSRYTRNPTDNAKVDFSDKLTGGFEGEEQVARLNLEGVLHEHGSASPPNAEICFTARPHSESTAKRTKRYEHGKGPCRHYFHRPSVGFRTDGSEYRP